MEYPPGAYARSRDGHTRVDCPLRASLAQTETLPVNLSGGSSKSPLTRGSHRDAPEAVLPGKPKTLSPSSLHSASVDQLDNPPVLNGGTALSLIYIPTLNNQRRLKGRQANSVLSVPRIDSSVTTASSPGGSGYSPTNCPSKDLRSKQVADIATDAMRVCSQTIVNVKAGIRPKPDTVHFAFMTELQANQQ
ncbi:hypothetical protein FRC07_005562, partial [Ceratobasidium sp. 392]